MDPEDRKYFTNLFENLSRQLDQYEQRLRTVEELVAVHQNLCKEHITFRNNISELQEDAAHTKGSSSGKYVTIGITTSLLNLVLIGILVYISITKGGV